MLARGSRPTGRRSRSEPPREVRRLASLGHPASARPVRRTVPTPPAAPVMRTRMSCVPNVSVRTRRGRGSWRGLRRRRGPRGRRGCRTLPLRGLRIGSSFLRPHGHILPRVTRQKDGCLRVAEHGQRTGRRGGSPPLDEPKSQDHRSTFRDPCACSPARVGLPPEMCQVCRQIC